MKNYTSYMDRQEISPEVHKKLLNLKVPQKRARPVWSRYGALAACAVLVLGLGVWGLTSSTPDGQTVQNALYPGIKDWYGPGEIPPDSAAAQFEQDDQSQPKEKDVWEFENLLPDPNPQAADREDLPDRGMEDAVSRAYPGDSFVVSGSGGADSKLAFPMIPGINYHDVTNTPSVSMDWCWAKGTFKVFLNKEDIQTIFWGPEGKPEPSHPKTEQGDLPWMLFWEDYTLRGHAWYSPEGELMEVYLTGEKDAASFELRLGPGRMPITCLVYLDQEPTDVLGVPVTGWSRVCDWDGDGKDDYMCGSEFMTKDNIGVRFENYGSSMRSEYVPDGDMDLGGACTFNALFVRQALTADGGLYLDHLLTADDIPDDPDATW